MASHGPHMLWEVAGRCSCRVHMSLGAEQGTWLHARHVGGDVLIGFAYRTMTKERAFTHETLHRNLMQARASDTLGVKHLVALFGLTLKSTCLD
jgi:hypothetical protein